MYKLKKTVGSNSFSAQFIKIIFHYKKIGYNINVLQHTGQCKRTGGCYNELVVAFFSTGGGVKGKKTYTC